MTDRNINLLDNESEKIRFAINMLPTALLMHASPDSKSIMKDFKQLSKKSIRQKIGLANIFNDLMTSLNTRHFSFTDFDLLTGDMSKEPYQLLLKSLGAENFTELYEHAKVVDDCINQPFDKNIIFEVKNYLESKFNYFNNDIVDTMPVDDFYACLILSFIAHLDACIHFYSCSELIKPISFGWLFMHKLDPDKWVYNSQQSKYISIKKSNNPFTIPSRSFIELLQTIKYWHTRKEMPNNTYGIDSKINWNIDDPDGKLIEFIKRKKEGKWISLDDLYWLLGFIKHPEDEPNETLEIWQKSFVDYITTEDLNNFGGLTPSFEGMIWFVYAYFQLIYIEANKENKLTKKNQGCKLYIEYYDVWQSITDYYEQKVDSSIKDDRIEWSNFLIKQATPIEGIA